MMILHYTEDNNIALMPIFKIYNNAKEGVTWVETEVEGFCADTNGELAVIRTDITVQM
jgi:hypothetical protein